MIYWFYTDDKPGIKLAAKIKKRGEKSQNQNCDVEEIGNKAEDIAAIILNGASFATLIALLAEELSLAASAVEAVLNSFFPFFFVYPKELIRPINGEGDIIA